MPEHVRPDLPPAVGDAVSAFGYGVRVAIIGYIHEHGPATRGQLATGLGLVPKTVQFHLTGLTALGVVIPDPPPEQARRGQRTRYEIDAARVLELYAELGKHLGIGE